MSLPPPRGTEPNPHWAAQQSNHLPQQRDRKPQQPRPHQGQSHGVKDDARYPSPRGLRRWLAFIVDLALTLGSGVGAFYASEHVPALPPLLSTYPTIDGLAGMIVVSLVHRTVVQWAFRATLGKAIFGLVVIRKSDGMRPTFGQLMKSWLVSLGYIVRVVFNDTGGSASDTDFGSKYYPSVVRYRDVRALK